MITTAEAKAWASISDRDYNETQLDLVVAAVNAYVDALPQIDRETPVEPETVGEWAGSTKFAALLLAGRLYRRRNSLGGIESSGEVRTFVSRYDSDIARLLHIDGFEYPEVG